MTGNGPDPPPSADPGPDPDRVLREMQESEAKVGCLGVTLKGTGAIIVLAGLVLLIVYLLGQCGS